MREGWSTKKLGNICTFEKAQDFHCGLPYVGLEDIASGTGSFLGTTDPVPVKSATFRFSKKHVLYGRLRPYLNKVLLPDFEGHCSTEIFPIRPASAVSREFLFYWLTSEVTVKAIDATSTGARMPRANMGAVLEFEFALPPLPEQRCIVAILDEAFEAIATAKANTEKNLQNARDLFRSHLQAICVARTNHLPKARLEKLCATGRLITYGVIKLGSHVNDGVPCLRTSNVRWLRIDTDGMKRIAPSLSAEYGRTILRGGDRRLPGVDPNRHPRLLGLRRGTRVARIADVGYGVNDTHRGDSKCMAPPLRQLK